MKKIQSLLVVLSFMMGCSPAFAWNNRTATPTFTLTKTFTPTVTVTPTITPTPNATDIVPFYNPPNTKNLYSTGFYSQSAFGLPALVNPLGLVLSVNPSDGDGMIITSTGQVHLRSHGAALQLGAEGNGVDFQAESLTNLGSIANASNPLAITTTGAGITMDAANSTLQLNPSSGPIVIGAIAHVVPVTLYGNIVQCNASPTPTCVTITAP